MTAPKNNQFWKLRSEHGRDAIFTDAEKMKESICEYFQYMVDTPFYKVEQSRGAKGKKELEVDDKGMREVDSGLVELPVMRPFTIEGLCHYLGVNTKYFWDFKKRLSEPENKLTLKQVEDFSEVITWAEEVIRRQKFEGAMVGFFSATITSKDLGMVDKKQLDHTTKGEPITGMTIVNGKK